MDKLRVAVVGVGFWGRNHARVYSTIEGVELVAVVDANESVAQSVAKSLSCEHFSSIDEMLRQKKIDAASVCTPSSTHATVSLELLKHGVNLLIEKPLTTTLAEGFRLLEEVKKSGAIVSVGFIERFNPAVRIIKEWVEKGALGKLTLFYSRRVSNWPERIGDVGVVKDLSIHDLDLARYIIGKEAINVYAVIGKARRGLYEDYANILARFDDSTAFVESNWLTPYKERLLIVTGSNATATANYLTQEVTFANADGKFMPVVRPTEPLKLELENFVKCVKTNTQPSPSIEDGLKALALAEAAIESSNTGLPVRPAY
ncbi:hypothetical protein B9Q13_02875 [Candidatus Marsarchaeota G2 archaeon ECH_B_SAG-G16]|jgi:UDP-N-acetylglucosamine 3-dehydrogenase|uniref:Gfo/Idh/MocA-like oxidoreductase N-terminal domain-containing protein n=4 Tax=Candidatus Marsarchaeota TaxID=1978152 RepID=A0A2R6ADX4_9ARCH|nr:MAG: hypothetical protein B9Q01_00085 [Candidatus Marsarchaeota G1 archaeon OSP_D]PSN89653.1 MAG: hypothetical protein B9Q00_00085 [Candidatus Marsarchaeota G1 archaeon OSP_C]PSN94741.1 MAG: hypothetical protein B9P99_01530 [Candidatus Marsarchaeota G1 archaeon OSP_B]PSO05080.1 MAG: hypothetical protein B9Q13_02875 [Candidatus Marsarchaeota G2 archaeon ECH_B_SAG-G16]